MLTMNRATVLGHAGRDPEFRTLPSGDEVASFSLATNERYRRRDGTAEETTEWHAIVAFGSAARTVRRLVHRGAAVLVEGRMATRAWTDRTGTEHRTSEIVVAGPQARVNVLTKRPEPGDGEGPGGGAAPAAAAKAGDAARGDVSEDAAAASSPAGKPVDAADAGRGAGSAETATAAGDPAGTGGVESGAVASTDAAAAAADEAVVPAGKEPETEVAAARDADSAGTGDTGTLQAEESGGDGTAANPPEDAEAGGAATTGPQGDMFAPKDASEGTEADAAARPGDAGHD